MKKFISIDRVLSKINRDIGLDDISEEQIIEWSGEALEMINSIPLQEQAVAFLEIKNHKAELPLGLHKIIQVAKNNKWEKQEEKICPINIVLDCPVGEEMDCNIQFNEENIREEESKCCVNVDKDLCNNPVITDCNGKLIGDYDIAYYRPYFDMQYWYKDWRCSKIFKRDFTPIRLANHTFFESLVYEEDESLYSKSRSSIEEEYTIQDNYIKTSFKEGGIAISFTRQKIDTETGYPMILDDISVIQALTYYITWKYMQKMWFLGREGYNDKMQYAEKQWTWYCKQAKVKSIIPKGVDGYQNLFDNKYTWIPNTKHYYNFFGKLGRSQEIVLNK